MDFAYPTCAGLLSAEETPSLLPGQRGVILAEINAAIARLRIELSARPKALPPSPRYPDLDFDDLQQFDRAMDEYRRQVRVMTPLGKKFYSIENRLRDLNTVADLVGRDQLMIDITGFQLVGRTAIRTYIDKVAANSCSAQFEAVFTRLRGTADSPLALRFERFEVTIRRWIAQKRDRTDFKCEVLHPVPGMDRIAVRLNAFWDGAIPFSEAYLGQSVAEVGRDFIAAFRPDPNVSELGWDGRGDRSDFLRRRRTEIIEEQIRHVARFLLLPGVLNVQPRSEEGLLSQLANQPRYTVAFDFIPGWTEVDGTGVPLLTVIKRIDDGSTRDQRPRRRAVVAPELVVEAPALGGAVPAR